MMADPLICLDPGYLVSQSSNDWKAGDPQVPQVKVIEHVVPRIRDC
jgi:hypothetical protein